MKNISDFINSIVTNMKHILIDNENENQERSISAKSNTLDLKKDMRKCVEDFTKCCGVSQSGGDRKHILEDSKVKVLTRGRFVPLSHLWVKVCIMIDGVDIYSIEYKTEQDLVVDTKIYRIDNEYINKEFLDEVFTYVLELIYKKINKEKELEQQLHENFKHREEDNKNTEKSKIAEINKSIKGL